MAFQAVRFIVSLVEIYADQADSTIGTSEVIRMPFFIHGRNQLSKTGLQEIAGQYDSSNSAKTSQTTIDTDTKANLLHICIPDCCKQTRNSGRNAH